MRIRVPSGPSGPIVPVACALLLAAVLTACGDSAPSNPAAPSGDASASASPAAVASATASPEPSASAAPTEAAPSPTPEPTEEPASPAPTESAAAPSPTASPSPSPSPTPSAAPAVTTVDAYAWTYDKHPMAIEGTAGTTTWTNLRFGAKTVELRWTARPAEGDACRLDYRLQSRQLPRDVRGTLRAREGKRAADERGATVNYASARLVVDTDCASYALRAVTTGHPGVSTDVSNDPYRVTGTTAAELSDDLEEATIGWSQQWSVRYQQTSPVRVTRFTTEVELDYELPRWNAPEGTPESEITAWRQALRATQTYLDGYAAIAIQGAGRFLADADRETFTSTKAMNDYYDRVGEKWSDWTSDEAEAYGETPG